MEAGESVEKPKVIAARQHKYRVRHLIDKRRLYLESRLNRCIKESDFIFAIKMVEEAMIRSQCQGCTGIWKGLIYASLPSDKRDEIAWSYRLRLREKIFTILKIPYKKELNANSLEHLVVEKSWMDDDKIWFTEESDEFAAEHLILEEGTMPFHCPTYFSEPLVKRIPLHIDQICFGNKCPFHREFAFLLRMIGTQWDTT